MLAWGHGPKIEPFDLTGNFSEVYIGKEDGQRHGYINGFTPPDYDKLANNPDFPPTHSNLIQIDEQIFGTLEVALGGGLDSKYSPGASSDLEKIRSDWKEILIPLFESTVLHEGVHFGRFEKKLPQLLSEPFKGTNTKEPGKAYEFIFYGKDISARIDNTQYSNPLPIKSINDENEK